MSASPNPVEGYTRPDFEGVRAAFEENFVRRREQIGRAHV